MYNKILFGLLTFISFNICNLYPVKGVKRVLVHESNVESVSEANKARVTIHEASKKGNKKLVESLIDQGFNVNLKDYEGASPLHNAVTSGNKEIVELLLSKNADINAQDINGESPVHYAIKKRNKGMVQFLLDKGANINGLSKWTPIHEAVRLCHKNSSDIIELLAKLENKANINAQDSLGWTPLHWASKYCNLETLRLLLEAGANVAIRNNKNELASDLARNEAIKNLINNFSSVNILRHR